MKILQIIYNLGTGGAERFTVDLCNEFVKLGHEVTLCTLRDDSDGNNGFYKKDLRNEVNYINLKIPSGIKIGNIYRLYKIISHLKPNIVHCHLNLVNYIFPLTYIFPGINFLHTIHNDAEKEVKSQLEYYLRKIFYTLGKVKPITISGETSKSFKQYYKIRSFSEILNGRSFPKPTPDFEKVKDEIIEESTTTFIHVGRYSPQKNQEMLIRVFNKLATNKHNTELFIIGSGFDSEEAKKLKDQAGNHIHFLGEKHNVADYFLNADAFCLSSIHEGMPITVIESLACGCVPVCTPAGGIKNMVTDGVTGFLSSSFSEDDYYNSLMRYLSGKDQLKKDDLIQEFKSKYHINVCAKNYLKAYDGIKI